MSSTTSNPQTKIPRRKDAEFIAGTNALFADRAPVHPNDNSIVRRTYTCHEIARACGLVPQTLRYIERKALRSLARELYKRYPEIFKMEMNDGQLDKFLAMLNSNPYRTGKPSHRHASGAKKHFKPVTWKVPVGTPTLRQTASLLYHQTPHPPSFVQQRDAYLAKKKAVA